MKKNLLYTALWLMGLMGTLAIWVVSAETTITHYTWSNIEYRLNNNTEHFTWVWTITITSWTDTITILDRNLWATVAGTWCDYTTSWWYCPYDETYWYHFQWWNNHWFKPWCVLSWSTYYCSDTITSGAVRWQVYATTISYNPASQEFYNSWVFYKGYSNWLTETDNSKVDLWWWSTGGTDTITSTSSLNWDNWKVDESTVTNRQWPCPNWFHVPSIWELYKLRSMLESDAKRNTGTLHNELLIPFAGLRDYNDASVYNMGYYANLWSSSHRSASSPNSRYLYLNVDGNLSMYHLYSAYATSVRCFYDSYQPFTQSFILSFTGSEWGSVSTWSIEAEEWNSISRDDEAGTVSISWTVVATGTSDEWYAFSGWLTDCDGDTVTTGCSFTGVFKLEIYMITYELNWWTNNENNLTWYTIKDSITFENPTKEWYTFDGWFTDAQFTTWITSISTWTTWPITVYAKWTENKKSSWSSGWGGRSNKTSDIQDSSTSSQNDKNTENVIQSDPEHSERGSEESSKTPMDSSTSSQNDGKSYTQEFQEAYEFAHEKWITTMPTINEANMNWKLTRIAMAKMLSYYAINVLWQKPDETRINKFNDITEKLDSQYDSGVTLAYQLWIMWINMPNNNFRPNDEVTRAEFATALSRMLYSTPDGKPYYTTHLQKLKAEWILTNDDYKMKELRGYVMIMLKRSAK